jgi:hypothetical protein
VTNTGDIAANSVTPALGLVGGAAVGISAPATNLAPGATAMVTLTFSSSAGKSGSAQPLFVLGFANGTEPNGTPPKDEGFWVKRAREQVNLTYYRLVFRQFFYTGPPNRGALPLPPRAIWHFDLALCEGQTLGANNQPVDPTNLSALVFDPTSLVDALGNPISRIRCNFSPNYAANNVGHVSVSQEQGSSFVNDPCDRGQAGPLRDCGFTPPTKIYSCPAGSKSPAALQDRWIKAGASRLRGRPDAWEGQSLYLPELRLQLDYRWRFRNRHLQLPRSPRCDCGRRRWVLVV